MLDANFFYASMPRHALFICTLPFSCIELPGVVTFLTIALELYNTLLGRVEPFDVTVMTEKSTDHMLVVCGGFLVFFDSI